MFYILIFCVTSVNLFGGLSVRNGDLRKCGIDLNGVLLVVLLMPLVDLLFIIYKIYCKR